MRSLDLVRNYFGREAARFDAIYERDKPLHQQLGDALFRRVILERFSLVLNAIGATTGKSGANGASAGVSVLDVGTGPGRYPIELARRGAARCLGVDVAAEMVEIAQSEAKKAGVDDRCEFVVSDFMSFRSDERFDAVIAMGYYDYLEDPAPHLRKMINSAKGRVFASFPKRWEFRAPLRLARFALARGFVRFYSRGEVAELFRSVGELPFLSIVDLGRDYIAIYDAGAAQSSAATAAHR